jgi:hypothetical protein
MANTDYSHCGVIDCGTGKLRTGEGAVPMFLRNDGDELIDKRGKELETFLKCLETYPLNAVILNEKSLIYHSGGSAYNTWFSNRTTKDALLEFLKNPKNHKVDGKKWCNGFLGSRWADTEINGKKCRIAFYSNKSDPEVFKGMPERLRGAGKDYILNINPCYFD